MSELLPCPFCGGEAHMSASSDGYGVQCWNRRCIDMQMEEIPTEAEAIKAWNTRADYHGYEQAAIEAWQIVKAYKERTCEKLPQLSDTTCIVRRGGMEMEFGYWRCSECECENFEGAKYCMGCGAKVVER